MIIGMHAIVFSPEAEKVRAFFTDVLGLPSVEGGDGWPIFAAPPAEIAIHPGDSGHKFFLMCDDINATLAELTAKGVAVASEITEHPWGLLSGVRMPDGTELGVYQPKHPSPMSLG